MACIEQKTDFNFLNWNKVVGSYTLAQLQASGVPSVCDNINSGEQGWNLSTAVINQTFSTDTQDNNPYQMFFKPDGLKMYIVGTHNDNVYEYDLSTAWNISTAVYLQSFDVSSQETFPFGLFFKPDGLKMYVIGTINNTVSEYDLSTAWDVTSAVYLQNKAVTGADTWAVFFKPDGLKMYIFNKQSKRIDEYNLSTAWDVSSSSALYQSYSITDDNTPSGMWFKTDGTKCYVVGNNSNIIIEYDLGTAWDITTMVYLQQISTGTETSPHNLFFKPDGTKMYLSGFISVRGIIEYDLTD